MSVTPVAAPVDAETASLLALIAGDPIHAADRAAIVAEIVQVARENDGLVSMNTVRARLWNEHGSTVYPPVIGATVNALAAQRALVAVGWEITTGSRTRNSGKPTRQYRYLPKRPATSPAGPTEGGASSTSPLRAPSVTSGGAS